MTDDRARDRVPEFVEENVERLLISALGEGARPEPHISLRTLERVRAGVRTRRAAVPFPDAVLALLGGLLACALAGLALLAVGGRLPAGDNPAVLLLSAAVALNLILVPVSGTVIVLRRQREQKR